VLFLFLKLFFFHALSTICPLLPLSSSFFPFHYFLILYFISFSSLFSSLFFPSFLSLSSLHFYPYREPLSLPDYLDALTTVRSVLSALYVLLLEHCSHPDLRGMGSEYGANKGDGIVTMAGGGGGVGGQNGTMR
jgi:hypothetical protein